MPTPLSADSESGICSKVQNLKNINGIEVFYFVRDGMGVTHTRIFQDRGTKPNETRREKRGLSTSRFSQMALWPQQMALIECPVLQYTPTVKRKKCTGSCCSPEEQVRFAGGVL